jgi:hypothetical protein
MKKNSTVATNRNEIFKEPKLTIGLDLGDRSSHYCILDEAGNVILEHNPCRHDKLFCHMRVLFGRTDVGRADDSSGFNISESFR